MVQLSKDTDRLDVGQILSRLEALRDEGFVSVGIWVVSQRLCQSLLSYSAFQYVLRVIASEDALKKGSAKGDSSL